MGMFATQIRPVTDLRNHYAEVEKDLECGPVVLTKNGYGASVLVSIGLYDKRMAKLSGGLQASGCVCEG